MYELSEEISLEKNKKHNIEIVVDRLAIREGIEKRMAESIESVMQLCGWSACGRRDWTESRLISARVFPARTVESVLMRLNRRSFSFNNPFGACPVCHGIGYRMEFAPELMIPDPSLSIDDGSYRCAGMAVCDKRGKFYQSDDGSIGKKIQF